MTQHAFNAERFREQRNALRRAMELMDEVNGECGGIRSAIALWEAARGHLAEAFDTSESDLALNSDTDLSRTALIWRRLRRSYGDTRYCDSCGEEFPRRLMLLDHDTYNRYCPFCVVDDCHYDFNWYERNTIRYAPEEDNSFLHDYSDSPIYELGRSHVAAPGEEVGETTRLFGFEIEFECDDLQGVAGENLSSAIFKQDGSVSAGAECCTLPMTRRAAEVELKMISDHLLRYNARAWSRSCCGLHIHVSRASASWLTWGKVDRFFANPGNSQFLDIIAGRSPNSYCFRESVNMQRVKIALDKHRYGHDRYAALNFSTGGKPTVEFRLFRGNVAFGGLMRAMEFCDSLIDWASMCSNNNPMHAFEYIGWLRQRAAAYPHLTQHMRKGEKDLKAA